MGNLLGTKKRLRDYKIYRWTNRGLVTFVNVVGAEATPNTPDDTRIIHVSLGWGGVKNEAAEAIANCLRHNKNNDAVALAEALKVARITRLTLCADEIGDQGKSALANALETSRIGNLDLEGAVNKIVLNFVDTEAYEQGEISELIVSNEIGEKGISVLINAWTSVRIFQNSARRVVLNFQDTGAKLGDISALVLPHLKDSTIRSNIFGYSVRKRLALAILDALKDTRTTYSLNLAGNRMGPEGAVALAFGLKGAPISSLNLEGNYIEEGGAIAIANILTDTPITHLNLEKNEIRGFGALMIAGVLKTSRLVHLDLRANGIGNAGASGIVDALKNCRITSLSLANNEIGNLETKYLADAMQYTEITILNLENNKIGTGGAVAIAQVLKNTQIISLNLKGNWIGRVGAKALANALEDTLMTELYLSPGNSIRGMAATLQRNRLTIEEVRQEFERLTSSKNGALEFTVVVEDTKLTQYIDITEMILRKKQRYIGLLSHESTTRTKDEITDFIQNIETRLSDFFGRTNQSCIEHVKLLLDCEIRRLNAVVEKLLFHRPNYLLIGIEETKHPLHGILHPAVCILMERYGLPWFFENMRPTKEDLIDIWKSSNWDHLIQQDRLKEFPCGHRTKERLLEILLTGSSRSEYQQCEIYVPPFHDVCEGEELL